MANTTVKSEQIEDGSITADKIADGAIVATELADNAVTTAKINADAVTGAKIADDAINSEHYTDGSIDTAHIADDQVTQAKIADDAVGADQLAASAVVTASIVDDNVTTAKIADGNISTALLADTAVTSAKLANNIDIAGTFDVTGATTLDAALTVDTTTLVVDASNNRVGIGTASPTRTLDINHASTAPDLRLGCDGNDRSLIILDADRSTEADPLGTIVWRWNNTDTAVIESRAGADTTNKDDGGLTFMTRTSGSALADAMTITSDGNVGIGITTPNESGFGATSNVLSIAGTAQDAFGVLELISTDVTSSNRIGEIRFGNLDAGSSFASNAGIRATRDGADNSSALSLWYSNAGTFAEGITLKSDGNVGIGNSNPKHPFIVHLTDGEIAMFGSNGMNSVGAYCGIGIGQVLANNTTYQKIQIVAEGRDNGNYVQDLHFLVDIAADANSAALADAKMTISGANGFVGIGTTTPTYRQLTINSSSGDSGHTFEVGGTRYWNTTVDTAGSPGSNSYWIGDAEDDNGVYVGQGGSSWSGISDERLKRNWTNIVNATDKIKTLTKVGTFQRRGKSTGKWSDNREVGLSAQEVEAILPEVVTTGGDIEFASDDKVTGVKGLSYEKLVPLLVKSIQELEARIKTLEDS
tara:strand:- start:9788 stop:11719 length:1932 start_codon:yes stop_codon:yes gene_type:complete